MINLKLSKTLNIIIKIFLVWLLVQFFLQTFVTYRLGLDWPVWDIIWLWKEIIIIWFFSYLTYIINKNKLRLTLRKRIPIKWFILIFTATLLVTFIVSIFINNVTLSTYIISIKYSMIGFLIFIIFFLITFLLWEEKDIDIIKRYGSVIKKILWFALIWRGIIWLIPRLLEFGWYNQYNYEWEIWISPPAVYYTQYNQWYVRNQFLFERPISLWFFLVAFWPLFFMLIIRKRWTKNALFRWWLYGLILLSTFSRAAWWVWLLQTFILIFIQYQKNFKKVFLYTLVPLIIIFGLVTWIGREQIIYRTFSNTGHFKMVVQAIEKIKERPFRWQWAWSAWPASYQITKGDEYNPENQFLQIWLEYWALGFLWRFLLYLYLHKIWYIAYYEAINSKNIKKNRFYAYLVLAFSLWLLGLSIEGLVLHSFVDRMIVYPFVALFGITYAIYYKSLNNKN